MGAGKVSAGNFWGGGGAKYFFSGPTCPQQERKILFSGSRKKVSKFRGKLFDLQLEFFCLQLGFFAYSPLRALFDALSHSQQKRSNCK